MSAPRFFVLLGAPTPEEAMDLAERHGPVVGAAFHSSPGGEAVYGWTEIAGRDDIEQATPATPRPMTT